MPTHSSRNVVCWTAMPSDGIQEIPLFSQEPIYLCCVWPSQVRWGMLGLKRRRHLVCLWRPKLAWSWKNCSYLLFTKYSCHLCYQAELDHRIKYVHMTSSARKEPDRDSAEQMFWVVREAKLQATAFECENVEWSSQIWRLKEWQDDILGKPCLWKCKLES